MPDEKEIEKWHRWFAVECNNSGWSLASKPDRNAAENREMLLSAQAAAFHWSKIGQPVNGARADLLLAHVHALLGDGARAMTHAKSCLNFCEANPCEDWDIAFAHAGVSLAAAVLGDAELHARHHAAAEKFGAKIKREEDREMFYEEFARLPKQARRA
jgi:hypothetical protein